MLRRKHFELHKEMQGTSLLLSSSKSGISQIPEYFLCPITNEIMENPVIDQEGNTYDESAIRKWLSHQGISPITRNPMSVDDLVPNRALKQAIEGKMSIKNSLSFGSIPISSLRYSYSDSPYSTRNSEAFSSCFSHNDGEDPEYDWRYG
jgi:hypothetical protein